jgi:hypothetical protein
LIVNNDNLPATSKDTLMLIVAIAQSTLELASLGQLIRGGVEMGFAIDSDEDEVIGSGMVHAYRLETTVAVYPRVCLGPRFMSYLAWMGSDAGMDQVKCPAEERFIVKHTVDLIRELVIIDQDGVPRVHFAAPGIWHEEDPRVVKTRFDSMRAALEAKSDAFDPLRELHLIAKYQWLLRALPTAPT